MRWLQLINSFQGQTCSITESFFVCGSKKWEWLITSYITMGERSQLLRLWDLTDEDLQFDTAGVLSTTTSPSCSSRSESKDEEGAEKLRHHPSTDLKLCESCYASNRVDANWCIECGTAMIGKSKICERPTESDPDVKCYSASKPDRRLQVS